MAKQLSAAEMVQRIRTETARRKRIWKLMRIAAHEAAIAVKQYAERQGIKSLEWFDGGRRGTETKQTDVFYQAGGERSIVKSFTLHADGRLTAKPEVDSKAYEDYPNLTEKDPPAFKQAAVERLMENFNEWRGQQRKTRRSIRR